MKHILPITLCLLVVAFSGCGSSEPPASAAEESAPAPAPTPDPEPSVEAQRIEIPNARQPKPGLLVGGQPTPEQLAEAAEAGYVTVVNLRPPGEQNEWDEAAKAAELGLRYVNLPIAGADDLNAENAQRLAEVVEDDAAHPIMVHCASGNRVGALFALKAHFLDGEEVESALQTGRDAGMTSLEKAVAEHLAATEP